MASKRARVIVISDSDDEDEGPAPQRAAGPAGQPLAQQQRAPTLDELLAARSRRRAEQREEALREAALAPERAERAARDETYYQEGAEQLAQSRAVAQALHAFNEDNRRRRLMAAMTEAERPSRQKRARAMQALLRGNSVLRRYRERK